MRDQIIASMARTLWVCAWFSYEEEKGRGGSSWQGQDLMDLAPKEPRKALSLAKKLAERIEGMNPGKSLSGQLCKSLKAEDPSSRELDLFGHYLVMQSLGHGVSWMDDHDDHDLILPLIEVWSDGRKTLESSGI